MVSVRRSIWVCVVGLALGHLDIAAAQPPPPSSPAEAERLYEQFLAVYRDQASTNQDLLRAEQQLKEAQRLAPDIYKYRFSLGAVNYSLGSYVDALAWFDRAYDVATSQKDRDAIESARGQCRAEIVKATIAHQAANVEPPGLQISFIMKQGTLEMEQASIDRMPQKLPRVAAAESAAPLIDALHHDVNGIEAVELNELVIAGWARPDALRSQFERGFKDHYAYLRAHYFPNPPDRKLVIVLSDNMEPLFRATQRLYPDVQIPVYAPFLGYYNPADHLIMATSGRAGYGTLLHELVHALMKSDFPDAPQWLGEGLASLYERTRWTQGRLEPLPNWRMDRLRENDVASVDRVVASTLQPSLSTNDLAVLRVLFLYVDSTRGMENLYRALRAGTALAPALAELGIAESGWRTFVAATFRDYRAELSMDKGALSNPDEVVFVQRALNLSLGINLAVDGIWGSATSDKIVDFQRAFGLPPDGQIGPQTMRELKRQFALHALE